MLPATVINITQTRLYHLYLCSMTDTPGKRLKNEKRCYDIFIAVNFHLMGFFFKFSYSFTSKTIFEPTDCTRNVFYFLRFYFSYYFYFNFAFFECHYINLLFSAVRIPELMILDQNKLVVSLPFDVTSYIRQKQLNTFSLRLRSPVIFFTDLQLAKLVLLSY